MATSVNGRFVEIVEKMKKAEQHIPVPGVILRPLVQDMAALLPHINDMRDRIVKLEVAIDRVRAVIDKWEQDPGEVSPLTLSAAEVREAISDVR